MEIQVPRTDDCFPTVGLGDGIPTLQREQELSNNLKIVKQPPVEDNNAQTTVENDYDVSLGRKGSRPVYTDSGHVPGPPVDQVLGGALRHRATKINNVVGNATTSTSVPSHLGLVGKRDTKRVTNTFDTVKRVTITFQMWNKAPSKRKEMTEYIHVDDTVDTMEIQDVLREVERNPVTIAEGTYGWVQKSRNPAHDNCLVKTIREGKLLNPNEVLVPMTLDFKNVLRVHGIYFSLGFCRMVVQNCGDNLKALLKDVNFMNYLKDHDNFRNFMMPLYSTVSKLEECRVVHGDLKLENVTAKLENGAYVPYLIDFGTCQISSDTPSVDGITPEFLPPIVNKFYLQLLSEELRPDMQGSLLFDQKCDSWSLGMIGVSLKNGGSHPVAAYGPGKVSLEKRIKAMRAISELTDSDVDAFMPRDGDPHILRALRGSLRINCNERVSAKENVELLMRARCPEQEGNITPFDIIRQQGSKRYITSGIPPHIVQSSPNPKRDVHQPWVSHNKQDDNDAEELANIFGGLEEKRTKLFQPPVYLLEKSADSQAPFLVPKEEDGAKDVMSKVTVRPCGGVDQGHLVEAPVSGSAFRQGPGGNGMASYGKAKVAHSPDALTDTSSQSGLGVYIRPSVFRLDGNFGLGNNVFTNSHSQNNFGLGNSVKTNNFGLGNAVDTNNQMTTWVCPSQPQPQQQVRMTQANVPNMTQLVVDSPAKTVNRRGSGHRRGNNLQEGTARGPRSPVEPNSAQLRSRSPLRLVTAMAEDDVDVTAATPAAAAYPQQLPCFGLLGMEEDMNKEQQPSTGRKAGGRRRTAPAGKGKTQAKK